MDLEDIIEFIFSGLLCIALVGALVGILIVFPVVTTKIAYSNEEEITITVKDKYVKTYSGSGTYIVVDENKDAYEVEDLLFKKKFNSTDIYNQLEIGHTYKVKVTGIRNHFLSMYRNINEIIEEV